MGRGADSGPFNSFIIDYNNLDSMIASIEQLITEIETLKETPPTAPCKRSRWTRKDEALFDQVFPP
jgi:Asp-tRNA(Asn)/Glu-tRNA(Gln) amidotransferase C subunit